jgi:hypothetical protein
MPAAKQVFLNRAVFNIFDLRRRGFAPELTRILITRCRDYRNGHIPGRAGYTSKTEALSTA